MRKVEYRAVVIREYLLYFKLQGVVGVGLEIEGATWRLALAETTAILYLGNLGTCSYLEIGQILN